MFQLPPLVVFKRSQQPKVELRGREIADDFLPENARLPRNIQGSFTCRKSTTWDRWLYFPSEGRCAEDFFRPVKIRRIRPGLNPRTWVPKASTLPLDHRSRFSYISMRSLCGRNSIVFVSPLKNHTRLQNNVCEITRYFKNSYFFSSPHFSL